MAQPIKENKKIQFNNVGSSKNEERVKMNSSATTQEEILSELYKAFSKGESQVGINDLCASLNKDEGGIYKALTELHDNSLASAVTNDSYKILPAGVILTESNKSASEVLISGNLAIREKILDDLAILHEEYGGSQSLHVQDFASVMKKDIYIIVNNTEILEDLGFITPYLMGDFRITKEGLLFIKNRKERQSLSLEFKKVLTMEAHNRGREFQNFFAKLASYEGWKEETSIRTSNEEIDVILYRKFEFFLVECKWEKKLIDAAVVREFYGKLDTREGMKGIIVSMSGFTEGAKEAVINHMSKRVILLFGSKDINDIVDQNIRFDDLLDEKYKQLVTKKKVLIS